MTMQLLPRADMATFPSKCLTCGSPSKPSVVFDVVQDWTGRMILCVECLTDAATKFCDVVPAARLNYYMGVAMIASERENRLKKALSEYKESIENVSADFIGRLDVLAGDYYDSQLVLELQDDSGSTEPEHQTGGTTGEQGPTGISISSGVIEFKEYADTGIRSL